VLLLVAAFSDELAGAWRRRLHPATVRIQCRFARYLFLAPVLADRSRGPVLCFLESPFLCLRGVTRHGVHCELRANRVAETAVAVVLHSPPRCKLRSIRKVSLGVSHVVGQTLGSHACRIGCGDAWGFYLSAGRNDSPFGLGSGLLACWPESQVWNSLSLLQTSMKASVTTYEGEQSRNSAHSASFNFASSSSRSCTTVVLGCLSGAFKIDIRPCFFLYLALLLFHNRSDYISVWTRAKHGPELLGAAGSDPTDLWGGIAATKVDPASFAFGRVLSGLLLAPYILRFRRLHASRGLKLKWFSLKAWY